MTETSFPLLVLSGPIGVGKTTVGQEISNLLDRRDIAHTFVDLDALTQTYPRPSDDRYGYRLAFANLTAIWTNCVSAGSRNLILSRVVESHADYEDIQSHLPGCLPKICQLSATEDNLLARVRSRELGVGLDWHKQRSLELAMHLKRNGPADFDILTDGRSPSEIAIEIADRVDWAGP